MLKDLEGCIEDPLFRMCVGRDFELEEFEAAMEYEAAGGRKAVFVLSKLLHLKIDHSPLNKSLHYTLFSDCGATCKAFQYLGSGRIC
jgi:hypothetical protein